MGYSIKDVSFAGSKITFSGAFNAEITDFMDDANPVEFQDCEVSAVGVNCNGNMIRYAKPSAIMMSVTVIPGSKSDVQLFECWRQFRIADEWQDIWAEPIQAKLDCGNGMSGDGGMTLGQGVARTLKNGTFVSGPAGVSSTGEGKMQGRTYTFAFLEAY